MRLNQLEAVIILHCVTECNEARLPRNLYEEKLRKMLKARGIECDVSRLLDVLMEPF